MIQIALPQPRRKARIEIIPLIDVIFFLLATFVLVSMSMVKNQGVSVRLPVATQSRQLDRGETLTVRVSKEGAVFMDKRELAVNALGAEFAAYKQSHNDPKIVIQGDTDASYGRVIAVLDAARKAGISKVAVQTTQKGD